MTSGRTAHWGTFDAERWWRPHDLAVLPAVTMPGGRSAVDAMDELLAGFCRPGDVLVTRHPVADVVRDGLAACGITFEPYAVSPAPGTADRPDPGTADGPALSTADGPPVTVDAMIAADPAARERIAACEEWQPYAVLPDTAALAARLGGPDRLPPVSVVAEVNSKTWSDGLVRKRGLPGAARVVRSAGELEAAVLECGFPAVVKDPYGVSGRGALELTTPGVLAAVRRAVGRQEAKGRRVELLVQPVYPKRCDFSGHLAVAPGGRATVLGVQTMSNRGFRHMGSQPADPGLTAVLMRAGYFDVLAEVADALADAGYWGPAGVDSMLLDDGTLIPVLEINARHSLGLLSLRLDEQAREHGLRCRLRQLDLAVPEGADIGTLCAELRRAGCRYGGGPHPGAAVLAGSTLAAPGGRVHCALFSRPDDADRLERQVLAAVSAAGMRPRGEEHAA
ncbi:MULTISPECIES: hypothetical protein [Streptomyces]|uniref:ATP-grasp domain-containing protein n=1 Tax=Streptomyces lycii TaxID=2654337 RepID=A0ABQ7FQU8_9ACTN|nr:MULTISPECIES: hypothetical protein [Streptomyces]KAF4410834.1 hypothetical protein GCU69_01680 [Streptomyces lycii]PGH50539.1 hypothetical protein CRI70_11500 [Streptomyces sp. Ru87]